MKGSVNSLLKICDKRIFEFAGSAIIMMLEEPQMGWAVYNLLATHIVYSEMLSLKAFKGQKLELNLFSSIQNSIHGFSLNYH